MMSSGRGGTDGRKIEKEEATKYVTVYYKNRRKSMMEKRALFVM
jgi:hypothetical protein